VEFLQVHAGVERSHLIRVAVEQQRLVHEDFAEAPFGGLAPARMIDVGIHVGIKAILIGSEAVPGGRRLGRLHFDFDDGLDAFVAVFPGDHHANWRAVLIGKRFAVHADAQKSEWMHGFIEAKAFDVRIVEASVTCLRHLLRVVKALKGHVFCFGGGFDELENGIERVADPGDHDGPAFDAAMAIDALFERGQLENFVQREFAGSFDFAFDRNSPRGGPEILRIFGGISLLAAELVEVVVVGDIVFGADFFVDRIVAFYSREFRGSVNRGGMPEQCGQAFAGNGGSSGDTNSAQKIAAVQVNALGSDLRWSEFRCFLDEHVYCLESLSRRCGCSFLKSYNIPAALDAERAARFPGGPGQRTRTFQQCAWMSEIVRNGGVGVRLETSGWLPWKSALVIREANLRHLLDAEGLKICVQLGPLERYEAPDGVPRWCGSGWCGNKGDENSLFDMEAGREKPHEERQRKSNFRPNLTVKVYATSSIRSIFQQVTAAIRLIAQ